MSIIIERATLEDREKVEVCVRAAGKFVRSYFSLFNVEKHYEAGSVWKAYDEEDPDTILGFAVAVPLKRTEVTSLYDFGVHPDTQGRGLGRKMLNIVNVGRPLRFVVDHRNTDGFLFYEACGLTPKTPEPAPTKPGSKNIVWRFEGMPS